jgi:hypothetical protein
MIMISTQQTNMLGWIIYCGNWLKQQSTGTMWTTVYRYTCHSTRTNYLNFEPKRIYSYALMQRSYGKSNKYQFASLLICGLSWPGLKLLTSACEASPLVIISLIVRWSTLKAHLSCLFRLFGFPIFWGAVMVVIVW